LTVPVILLILTFQSSRDQQLIQQQTGITRPPGLYINMEITIDNVYDYLEANKSSLNYFRRDDVVTDCGKSQFCSLVYEKVKGIHNIPQPVLDFLLKIFNITEKDYHFIQIQKYEIGEYILPHKDSYPSFGLLTLSTSSLDGLTVEGHDGKYTFVPDQAGRFIDVPKYRWHWVNPVREKTRYSAVYGLNPVKDYDSILEQ